MLDVVFFNFGIRVVRGVTRVIQLRFCFHQRESSLAAFSDHCVIGDSILILSHASLDQSPLRTCHVSSQAGLCAATTSVF